MEMLKSDITAFIKARGITRTEFGREAIGDPNFLRNLDEGRKPRIDTLERVKSYMKESV